MGLTNKDKAIERERERERGEKKLKGKKTIV
jgi:hypothetical protein